MPKPHPASRGAKRYGQIWTRDGLACNVSRAADGRFYTDHFRLSGPFDNRSHLMQQFRRWYGSLDPQLVLKWDGPRDRLRGAPSPVATEDPQPPPPPSEELVAAVVESASALTLQKPYVSSPEELLGTTSSEGSMTESSPPLAPSPAPRILARYPRNWYQVFYIRMDRGGSFCMYPNLGGPFQSIDEADDAIDRYLDELQSRAMCKEQVKLSVVDRLIHNYKHYLDGTPKRGPNAPTEDEKFYLVQAVLQQYNEDHNLFGNHAHELEALVGQQWNWENHRWYYHFNFTIKKKEGTDMSTSNLFFAEVLHMQGQKDWEVNCCCMINHDENSHCYGCRNNGSPGMKHPNNTGAYAGGHLGGYLPFGCEDVSSDEEAEEERLRARFKGMDDPDVWDRIKRMTPKCSAKRIVVGA